MEDKTPIYLLSIVGIVALVAVIYMFAGSGHQSGAADYGNSITGNIVDEDIAPVDYSGFGRFVVAVALIGTCAYLYRKVE